MIKTENVSHAYNGTEHVLKDVSFDIKESEKVVLLGTNGSGKTTLLKILNGLIQPAAGRCYYKSHELSKSNFKSKDFNAMFRREVVLLFQNPESMIFNPTVYDEIAFSLRQFESDGIDEKVKHWADIVGVTRYLGRPPFQLSSGEKQKVCLASLLVLEPRLLLMDEPTATLDPRSTGWLVDFLQDLDVTTLVTTHNLSLASELGERTMVLSEQHELIYDGPLDLLLEDQDKLLEANLLHVHRHKHEGIEHKHYHTHDWE
jgi:cobalt/nickel transport system ATP-binding protein